MILNAMLPDDYHERAYIVRKAGDRRKATSPFTGVYKDKYYISSKKFSKLKGKANRFKNNYISSHDESMFSVMTRKAANFSVKIEFEILINVKY